jgi:hypothetical protein
MSASADGKKSTSEKILAAIEPIIYAKPTLTFSILMVITVAFIVSIALKWRPDAGFDKQIPLEHEYMRVLKQYESDFGSANNVLVALIKKPGTGTIYEEKFLAALKQTTDDVFFLKGVDRARVSSLFTPDVRYIEVVEGGFKGGNVIPAEYQPTPEMFQIVRDNVNKGGHVGRFTTKDERGAMVFSELLERDPVTGEKLDYDKLAFDLEDKIRGRYMSQKKYVYTLTKDIIAGEDYPIKDGEKLKAGEVIFKKGEQVYEGFAQITAVQKYIRKFDALKKLEDGSIIIPVKGKFLEVKEVENPQYDPNVNVHILGFAKVVGDITDAIPKVVGFFLGTLIMTMFLLWAYLGSFKLALLPLFCSIAAVVWEFGMLFGLGFGLDPFAILVPFLILSVSVSHAVQYCNAWVAEITLNGRNSFDASLETWRRLAIYGTMAIMTDVVGFILIALIPIDIVQEMAYNATLGMVAIIITNKIMMPIMLTWIDIGDPKEFAAKQDKRDAIFDPIWHVISNMVKPKQATIAILLSGLLLGWSLWKGKELQVGDSQAGVPELLPFTKEAEKEFEGKAIPKSLRYNYDTKQVTENFAIGTDVIKVIAETQPDACTLYEVMHQIDRMGWHLTNDPGVQSVISLPWAGKQVNSAFNEAAPKYKVLPRNKFVMVQAITPIPTSTGLLNANCSAMAIFVFTKDHKAGTLEGIVNRVKKFNTDNAAEFYDDHKDIKPETCDARLKALRVFGEAKVAKRKFVEKYKSTHPGVKDEVIEKLDKYKKLDETYKSTEAEFKKVERTVCPVNFALASAPTGVMAATNEVVHFWEKPILGIVYVGIILCVYLSFFEFTSIVCIMLPLALVSWMAYAVMAILGIGMKTATLPVVALAAGIGVDYGIYVYATMADAAACGFSLKEGLFRTLKMTGKAVVFTGITLSLGVATWLFSDLQFQRDMGKLLIFMFTANMFGAILLLPAIASFLLKVKQLAPGEMPVFKTRH